LFMSYPATSGFDTLVINQPSMFLGEIPKKLIEEVKVKEEFRNPGFRPKNRFSDPDYDEPSIVLDDDGERIKKPSPGSFLRDISDL